MTVKSVLAIDDSLTIRRLVSETLIGAGFSVTTAEHGEAGVRCFREGRFDAVITDINMPVMDGFGVIAAIRGGDRNRKVPIIVLTTEGSPEFRARARSGGATGWVQKPFDDEQLIGVIRQVTGLGAA